MNGFPVPGRNFGKNTPYGEQAAELAEQYCAIAAQARCGLVQEQLATLIDVAKSVADAFARRKREAGLLDNNDLLSFASRAFRDHPAIQAAYVDRFKLVMVDEFQDTDQLQVDMIKRMAGEGFSRMCTVGDAQQSIYRFRGADVSVYRRHLEDVRTRNPEGIIELPDNFRSHGDVLALCDRIFEQPQVFGAGFMSLAPGRAESKVKRPFLPDGPRVQVQVTVAPSRGVSSADAAAVAARRVAKSFSEFAAAGHRPGDMVVLLGGMSRANVYAEALRAEGLPCVVAGGSIFNRAPEVALMVRLAQAIANPKWTTALFEVLSSELFALSADDLLELSTGMDEERGIPRRRAFDQGFRHIERKVAAGRAVSPALAACASLMRRASEQVGNVALADIMQGIVADSGWLARLEAAGPEGLARAGNVYKAIRMARDIEAAGGVGPAGVAEELSLRVELAKEAPGALSAEGGDFVRIMTVHASKGLEFPIVAVAELRDDAARSQALECCSIEGRTYVSLDGGHVLERLKEKTSSLVAKSGSYQPFFEFDDEELTAMVSRSQLPADRRAAIKLHEERGEAAESRRLLYVALTRAKEALVVSMRGKSSKVDATGLSKSCWGDVQSALVGEGCVFEPGVSMFDFGGQRPARVECVHLTPAVVEEMLGDADGVAGDAADGAALRVDGGPGVDEAAAGGLLDGVATDGGLGVGGQGVGEAAVGGSPAGGKPGVIALPVVGPYEPERGKPYAGARAGMFSYSSIAEDADGLVDFSVEDAADDAVSASLGARDADAATSLGTAFHRLAQLAALAWQPGCALERPDVARQQALERSCRLSADQRDRLDAALERWFASDIAARVGACESVILEAPFLVRVGGPCDVAYLEGEIDLLGRIARAGTRERPAGSALVVDYKTGGLPGETAEQLHEKHLLQATCYAYAVLLEGYAQVECVFVRVEQDRVDAPGQPQTVSYRFDAADADEMGRALARAYHGHGQL